MIKSEKARRYREKNPERHAQWNREWRARNPERDAAIRKRAKLKKYGLTPDEYDQMFVDQGGVCAACGLAEPRGGRWVVDHCHGTGTVRGIICNGCNVALGQVGESIDALLDLANYLKQRESVNA